MENEGENPRAPETNPSVDQQDTYTTGTGASVLGTSLTYDDPSHAAKICQGLDSMRLLIRYKKKKDIFIRRLGDQAEITELFQQKPTHHLRILA